jgi:hypothetical protein
MPWLPDDNESQYIRLWGVMVAAASEVPSVGRGRDRLAGLVQIVNGFNGAFGADFVRVLSARGSTAWWA